MEAVGRRIPTATASLGRWPDATLRRAGRSPEPHIGVSKDGQSFEVHAWLALDGVVLVGDHDLDRYTPITGGPA